MRTFRFSGRLGHITRSTSFQMFAAHAFILDEAELKKKHHDVELCYFCKQQYLKHNVLFVLELNKTNPFWL